MLMRQLLVGVLSALLTIGASVAKDVKYPKKYQCENKYCGGMESCSEAHYNLTQCGLGRLDRDKDGIPCESICGKTKSSMYRKIKQGR